ncbi:MAG: C40 family peptidase [Bacteroidales bacterium]
MSIGFATIGLTIVPVRREPDHRTEMVNQLLFGDMAVVREKMGDWCLVESVSDRYEGWVDQTQLTFLEEDEYRKYLNLSVVRVGHLVDYLSGADERMMLVTYGAALRGIEENRFEFNGVNYHLDEPCTGPVSLTPEALVNEAMLWLGVPYLWGGRSPFGVDCSGFVQLLFSRYGVDLPRDAWQQATVGEQVAFQSEARKGDLFFFDNQDGDIVHVGVYCGNDRIIHSSGKVRLDPVDHQGIYRQETGTYSHRLRLIRRIL